MRNHYETAKIDKKICPSIVYCTPSFNGTLFSDISKPTTGGGYGAPRSSDVVNPRTGPNLNTLVTSPTEDLNRDVKFDRDVKLDPQIFAL